MGPPFETFNGCLSPLFTSRGRLLWHQSSTVLRPCYPSDYMISWIGVALACVELYLAAVQLGRPAPPISSTYWDLPVLASSASPCPPQGTLSPPQAC